MNRYFLTDALGSTVALTDATGALRTDYTYEPFGKATASGDSSTNAFQFTGRENDGTGLQYSRARYYNPTWGRFISEDPIGFEAGDPNLYGYVFNSPTNFTDPTGKLTVVVVVLLVVLLGGAAVMAGHYINEHADDGGDESEGEGEAEDAPFGSTPEGRPYTEPGARKADKRNIPGSVTDETINNNPGVPQERGKTEYYDPVNDVTVVTGDNGAIVSVRRGPPRAPKP